MYKLYGAKGCPDCQRSVDLLKYKEIPYLFVDVSKDTSQMPAGHKSIPVIYNTAGKLVGGYMDLIVHLS